jgi:hypothetical protein
MRYFINAAVRVDDGKTFLRMKDLQSYRTTSESQFPENGRKCRIQQTLILDVVQMLHVLRSAFANNVASSREISGAERSERSRALMKTARATLISCV